MVSTVTRDNTDEVERTGAPARSPVPATAGAYLYGRGRPAAPPRFWTTDDFQDAQQLFGQALATVGARPGDLVAIHLANPSVAWTVGTAVMAMAGRAWPVAGPPPGVPDVLVTDPWTALGWPARQAPRLVVLTESVGGMVPALRERIREQWGNAPVIRSWYGLVDIPGPLAVECAEGALHGRRPGDDHGVTLEVAVGGDGPAGPLVITTTGPRVTALERWDTGDVARVVACGCGHPGLALGDLERASDGIGLGPVAVSRTRLLSALFRTPGFGGAARVVVRRDRARGQDELAITVSVTAGWDAAQVADAVATSVAAVAHHRPRVAVDRDLLVPGVTVTDQRAHASTRAAHTRAPSA